jgi:hypothetical protein
VSAGVASASACAATASQAVHSVLQAHMRMAGVLWRVLYAAQVAAAAAVLRMTQSAAQPKHDDTAHLAATCSWEAC